MLWCIHNLHYGAALIYDFLSLVDCSSFRNKETEPSRLDQLISIRIRHIL
jgi:hypothetical protein